MVAELTARGACAQITNPLPSNLDFLVQTEGQALFAPKVLSVKPGEQGALEVAFCPTQATEGTGQVVLKNAQLGEFRYGVTTKAKPDPGKPTPATNLAPGAIPEEEGA